MLTTSFIHGPCVTHKRVYTQNVASLYAGPRVAFTSMNWKNKIGLRIRAARLAKEWTLAELSKKTGRVLSPSRISNYEQGLRLCKAQDAAILSAALDVSASHLQCLDERASDEDDMTLEQSRLLRSWGALPENERMMYLRRIETLALAYREPVPDEKLTHLAAPKVKTTKKRRGKLRA